MVSKSKAANESSFLNRKAIYNVTKNDLSPPKWEWLWSRDCCNILPFAVMQRVERVRQRHVKDGGHPPFCICYTPVGTIKE